MTASFIVAAAGLTALRYNYEDKLPISRPIVINNIVPVH